MRLVIDTIEFGAREMPRWNTISISGYHIREAGATAAQELAFTLADGREYVRWCLARGLDVDAFAPHLSFFFNAHNDFFEEICEVSRGPPHLGPCDARNLRRDRRPLLLAALPLPDGRRLA